MTENTFKTALLGLGEYFNKKISEPLAKIYWRQLSGMNDQDFIEAVDRCVAELKFFPKVNEIVERVPERKQLELKAGLSWCENTQRLLNKYPTKKGGKL